MAERIPLGGTIRIPLQAYLASDHVSPATGKTIAITISKNGAAYGNPNAGATNATGIANGSYYVDLDATDTGTAGPLFVRGTEGTIDDVITIYNVVAATNGGFTALPAVAAGANGGVPLVGSQIPNANAAANGGLPTIGVTIPNATAGAAGGLFIAGSNAATTAASLTVTAALTTGSIVNNGATTLSGNVTLSGTLGVGAVTLSALTISNNLIVTGTSTFTGATTYTGNVGYTNGVFIAGGAQVHALQLSAAATGDGLRIAGNTTGSGIRSTGGATGDGARFIGGATSGDGIVASGPTAGSGATFTGAGGGHGASFAGNLGAGGIGILASGLAGMWLAGTEGLHIQTNNTNENAVFIQGGGDTPSGIVLTGGVSIAGPTAGAAVTIAALAASGGAGISARGDGAGLDITAPDHDLGGAVWDVTLAGHLNVGSTGEALNAAGAAGDPWITALPGAYGAGSAGFIVGTNLNATVSGVPTATWAVTLDGALTAGEMARGIAAAASGKVSGLPGAPVFRNMSDTKNVIVATTDSDGNRLTVTYDLTP